MNQPFQIDHQSLTLQDIAERCGVSKSTVSRAMVNDPRINAATRERVLAVAAEMGYNPSQNAAARRLALRGRGRDLLNHQIALCIRADMYTINYFSRMFKGIVDAMAQTDFSLLLMLVAPTDAPTVTFPMAFERGEIDGILLCADIHIANLPERLQQHPVLRSCPVVGTTTKEFRNITAVLADEGQGAYLATKHLLELGHRHVIHHLGHAEQENYQKRLAGVYRAYAEMKLDAGAYLHLMPFPGEWLDPHDLFSDNPFAESTSEARRFIAHLLGYLQDHPEITALLPLNDAIAIRLWRVLQRAGYRIPDDYSIIGFDDTDPMPDLAGRNLLTSVHLPLEEIGREAVRLIMHQIAARQKEQVEVVLPTELILRRSTGSARAQ